MTNAEVPRVATPLTPVELARALREGHIMWCASAPSDARLAIAWAHVAQEAGQGTLLTNNNFGHIMRGSTWTGPVYLWGTTPERGHDGIWRPTPMRFRSYDSAACGADDYWRVMSGSRYSPALALFDRGDARGAAARLGALGWYTASPTVYAAGMVSLAAKARSTVLPALAELVTGDPETAGRLLALSDAVMAGRVGLPRNNT